MPNTRKGSWEETEETTGQFCQEHRRWFARKRTTGRAASAGRVVAPRSFAGKIRAKVLALRRRLTEDATFAVTITASSHCPLCGKTIPRGRERLIVETDDPPHKVHVEVCG